MQNMSLSLLLCTYSGNEEQKKYCLYTSVYTHLPTWTVCGGKRSHLTAWYHLHAELEYVSVRNLQHHLYIPIGTRR